MVTATVDVALYQQQQPHCCHPAAASRAQVSCYAPLRSPNSVIGGWQWAAVPERRMQHGTVSTCSARYGVAVGAVTVVLCAVPRPNA